MFENAKDLSVFEALAKYVPEERRAERWTVAAMLPSDADLSAGASPHVLLPPLHMVINDKSVMGVPNVTVSARLLRYTGTCSVPNAQPSPPSSPPPQKSYRDLRRPPLIGPTIVGAGSNITDAAGVAVRTPPSLPHPRRPR
jgi:hypothetical protein